GSVYIVAHADDDLLFQSPDLLTDMQAGNCITTLFMTAGDSGIGMTYARARESGNEAATAQMAGVDDSYTEFNATFGGQPVLVRTLVGAPNVQKVWFRLPDGDVDGTGYAPTGYETLRELYFGSISQITNVPGTSTYTLATLKLAISQILTARQPTIVRTLDYMSDYDAGDHSDHLTTARITASLVPTYASGASFAGSAYMGYPIANLPPTMKEKDTLFQGKTAAFFTYTPYDSGECQSYSACVSAGRGEASWLRRSYVVTADLAEVDYTGSAQTVTILPDLPNVALVASVEASSEDPTQPATAAIDNVVSGYPGNSSAEWSTVGGLIGTTLTLTWPIPQNISAVALFDRPNPNDWIQGGTLTFSDNSTVSFGFLNNEGSATLVTLDTPVVTTSILMTVTAVATSSSNVGLAEIKAYGNPCATCSITSANATSNINLAMLATATASSYASAAQGPPKAIDGVATGYPTDYTREWASNGETVGAWLKLTWSRMYSIDSIVLYDRPNTDDWITGGTITWSDGTTLTVPSLYNAGTATTLSFATKNTSSIKFTVTSTSSSTSNAGLSEIQAYYSGVQPDPSTMTASYAQGADLALFASATASSYSSGQPPSAAIDGWVGGYTPDGGIYTEEWASNGQGAGATLTLTWPSSIEIGQVILFDRPNEDDQVSILFIVLFFFLKLNKPVPLLFRSCPAPSLSTMELSSKLESSRTMAQLCPSPSRPLSQQKFSSSL
ncbi:hypothetical protein T439DRAFT_283260, partial [Meredithblackwellia eburnea MCA 4105]